LVSCNEASIALGFLLSYICSYGITVGVGRDEGWRIMFGLSGLIAVVQWCLMLRMPESPVWLDENGFEEEAQAALRLIGGDDVGQRVAEEAEADLRLDEDDAAGEAAMAQDDDDGEPSELDIRPHKSDYHVDDEEHSPYPVDPVVDANAMIPREHPSLSHYWRQAVIAAFLSVAQQLCGHINILNFAPEIFSQLFYGTSTEDNSEALLATTVILGTVKFVITSLVIWEVDTLGRRYLLLWGMVLVSVSLLLLAIAFSPSLEDPFLNEDTGNMDTRYSKTQQGLALVGCTGVVAGYALSYGPLTWLITSEVFPSAARGRAIGFATVLTHASAALVSYTFLTGQERWGPAAPFGMYLTFSVLSAMFAYVAVPDTGDVRAEGDGEDVDALLDEMWFWRQQHCFCCWWCCGCCNRGGGAEGIDGGGSRRIVRKEQSLRDVDGAFGDVDEDLGLSDRQIT